MSKTIHYSGLLSAPPPPPHLTSVLFHLIATCLSPGRPRVLHPLIDTRQTKHERARSVDWANGAISLIYLWVVPLYRSGHEMPLGSIPLLTEFPSDSPLGNRCFALLVRASPPVHFWSQKFHGVSIVFLYRASAKTSQQRALWCRCTDPSLIPYSSTSVPHVLKMLVSRRAWHGTYLFCHASLSETTCIWVVEELVHFHTLKRGRIGLFQGRLAGNIFPLGQIWRSRT